MRELIASGTCPNCRGELVMRTSTVGGFLDGGICVPCGISWEADHGWSGLSDPVTKARPATRGALVGVDP
jgi:hypothetical protein